MKLDHYQVLGLVPIGDAIEYDAWAQRIAAGDWIGSEVFYQAPLYPYCLGVLFALAGHGLHAVRDAVATLELARTRALQQGRSDDARAIDQALATIRR